MHSYTYESASQDTQVRSMPHPCSDIDMCNTYRLYADGEACAPNKNNLHAFTRVLRAAHAGGGGCYLRAVKRSGEQCTIDRASCCAACGEHDGKIAGKL